MATIYGGSGDDTITGTTGNDSLGGGDGNDVVSGEAGNDTVAGDVGNDTVYGGTGQDHVWGWDGDDLLYGGDDADTLGGDLGNDTAYGDAGNDELFGSEGFDELHGGTGDDWIEGGNDGDTLYGDAGMDELYGDPGDDALYGGDDADTLVGGSGFDTLSGGTGDDSIDAGTDDDTVSGGDGNDYIDAGHGSDVVWGGAGNDTIVSQTGNDYIDAGAGDDSVTLDSYSTDVKTIAFGHGAGSDTVSGFDPDYDQIYVGDLDPADIIVTATANPRIFKLTIAGGDPADNLTIDYTYHYNGSLTTTDIAALVVDSGTYTAPSCLTPGARIDTPGGPRRVGALRPGDMVSTLDHGPQPLRHILRARYPPQMLTREASLRPVVLPAGLLGPGLPGRSIQLSRQHGVLSADGSALIRAAHLPEELGLGRIQKARRNPVTYIHLLTHRHEIVRIDGLWVETLWPGAPAARGLGATDKTRARPLLSRRAVRQRGATLFANALEKT